MKSTALLYIFLFLIPLCSFIAGLDEVVGYYHGEKEDYATEIKLYDDSVFTYTASREFPFEVSEGTWILKGDTVILNTTPCKDPAALEHIPKRTYITFTDARYLYKKNALIPLVDNKQVKGESLSKEK